MLSAPDAMMLVHPAPVGARPLQARYGDTAMSAAPGEVLIEVEACAVCRTDLQLVEGDLPAARLPIVPGHQIAGAVREIGAGRSAFIDADPVTTAPLLCGGAIGYRSLRVAGVEPGERVGLYGFGASASLVIQIAHHWGCEVAVATRQPVEQERARSLGAAWVGAYDDAPPFPLDRAITFAPAGDVVVAALRALDRGGVVAVNAIHIDRIPSFAYEHLWWERSVRSVANVTRHDVRDLLRLAGEIPLHPTVRTYRLDEANEALADLRSGSVHATAVLTPG